MHSMHETKRALWQIAWCSALLSGITGTLPFAAAQEMAVVKTPAAAELPDSPGETARLRTQTASQNESGQVPGSSNADQFAAERAQAADIQDQQPQSQPSTDTPAQATSTQQQAPSQKPVGTAAAGAIPVSGVAASQPTGVAIAPAKQRRVRTIVLRMGAILGAGVAVGSVVALTQATPSKPPGAH